MGPTTGKWYLGTTKLSCALEDVGTALILQITLLFFVGSIPNLLSLMNCWLISPAPSFVPLKNPDVFHFSAEIPISLVNWACESLTELRQQRGGADRVHHPAPRLVT